MGQKLPSLPLAAFIGPWDGEGPLHVNPKAVPALRDADIVFGRHVRNGHEFIVFGREALKKIAESREEERHQLLVIEVDAESDSMKALLALVIAVKGYHDYKANDDV